MNHARNDGFGNLDSGIDVDLENAVDFVVGRFDKVNWVGVRSTDVVN